MGDSMSERKWTRTSATSIRCAPWTIATVTVAGRQSAELWHDDKPHTIGRFDSVSEALDGARREENRINRGKEND